MADTDFVYGLADLPADKVHADGFANPVTNATKRWSANDGSRVFAALRGIRDALDSGPLNVLSFATVASPVDPTGVADSTAGIQAAITACAGRTLYFPRGKYKVTSTLFITDRSTHIVGDFANRSTENGTEISYTGVGPCIQIHTDSGNPWHDNEYNGKQDHVFDHLTIRHGAPDTALASAGGIGAHVKIGAYGVWDWRGGGWTMNRVRFEHFEANFVGVQSDINMFLDCESNYSKYGFYLGPRSDQNTIIGMRSIFCDRAITIDRAGGTRIAYGQFVGCGHNAASAIEIRKGATIGPFGVSIDRCWFETHSQGYAGTDGLAFVQVGVVNGYGAGGSIQAPGGAPSTGSVVGCTITNPQLITIIGGQPTHVKYLASVGFCQQFNLDWPANQNSGSLTNLDALVGIEASQAPTNNDTQISISGVSSGLAPSKLFVNLGGGSPDLRFSTNGPSGAKEYSTSRWSINTPGGAAGADEVSLSQEGQVGEFWIRAPNVPGTKQVTRLRLARSRQTTFVASGPPAAGTWEAGDRVDVLDATQTGFAGFYCWIGGTPGTWAPYGKIEGRELVPAVLGANQNDYNPTSFAPSKVLLLTASVPVNITGIVAGLVVAGSSGSTGEEIYVYNDGANNITLTHQDAASAAANRIIGRGNANVVLTPATGVLLYYSPSKTRWLVLGDTL